MSVESARAFCMRLMSDDEFRNAIGKAASCAAVQELMKKESYDFSQHELLKIVGELIGKKMSAEELKAMVCEFYAEEVAADNPQASAIVAEWFDSLQG